MSAVAPMLQVPVPADNVIVQRTVEPFLTSTVPVGVPANCGVTVEVKVTDCSLPYATVLGDTVRDVVVVALLTVIAADALDPEPPSA